MALTAAEKKELDALKAEFGISPTSKKTSKLSAVEAAEMQALKQELGVSEAPTPVIPNETASSRGVTIGAPSALASKLTLGAAPLVAGASAMAGYLYEGGSFSESKAIFEQARGEYNQDVAIAEKEYPSIAAVANAGEFISKAVPAGHLANFGLSITEQVGQNGFNVESVAKGAAFAGAGAGAAVVINKAASYVSRWGATVTLGKGFEKLGVKTKAGITGLYNTIIHKGQDPEKFVQRLSEYEINGGPIFEGSLLAIRGKTSMKLDQLGEEIGDIMSDLSVKVPPMIPASNLQRRISDTVDDISNSANPTDLTIVANIKNSLLDLQEKGVLSLSDIHSFKKKIASGINWESLDTSNSFNPKMELLYKKTSEFFMEQIPDSGMSNTLKNSLRAANEEYSSLMIVNNITAKDPGKEFEKLYSSMLLGEKIKEFLMSPLSSMGNMAEIMANEILTPLQKPALAKVLTAAANGVEAINPYITKITQGLGRDPGIFGDLLANAESTLDLYLDPVQRNTDSMLKNESQIYNILRESDPKLAFKFNESIKEEDYSTIGELMSSMSNLPKFRKFIEPGLGWDGKVTNETEKEIVRGRILGANLSVIQQMTQIENLDKSGIIPADEPKNELRQLARKPMRDAAGKKKEEY